MVRTSKGLTIFFMKKSLYVWMVMISVFTMLCLGSACDTDWGKVNATGKENSIEAAGLRGHRIEDTQPDLKKVALTFDDGPHPKYTSQLLDGLSKRKIRATFFVTGENAELYPELIKRMSDEGHLIGNHTYSHIQLRQGNRDKFREELVLTNRVIEQITGENVTYVRPPYGTWEKSFEKELNMIPVLWTIDPLDWCCTDASCIVRKVESAAQENAIILLHDSYASTVTAALQIADDLQQQGYVFVTVEEILFD